MAKRRLVLIEGHIAIGIFRRDYIATPVTSAHGFIGIVPDENEIGRPRWQPRLSSETAGFTLTPGLSDFCQVDSAYSHQKRVSDNKISTDQDWIYVILSSDAASVVIIDPLRQIRQYHQYIRYVSSYYIDLIQDVFIFSNQFRLQPIFDHRIGSSCHYRRSSHDDHSNDRRSSSVSTIIKVSLQSGDLYIDTNLDRILFCRLISWKFPKVGASTEHVFHEATVPVPWLCPHLQNEIRNIIRLGYCPHDRIAVINQLMNESNAVATITSNSSQSQLLSHQQRLWEVAAGLSFYLPKDHDSSVSNSFSALSSSSSAAAAVAPSTSYDPSWSILADEIDEVLLVHMTTNPQALGSSTGSYVPAAIVSLWSKPCNLNNDRNGIYFYGETIILSQDRFKWYSSADVSSDGSDRGLKSSTERAIDRSSTEKRLERLIPVSLLDNQVVQSDYRQLSTSIAASESASAQTPGPASGTSVVYTILSRYYHHLVRILVLRDHLENDLFLNQRRFPMDAAAVSTMNSSSSLASLKMTTKPRLFTSKQLYLKPRTFDVPNDGYDTRTVFTYFYSYILDTSACPDISSYSTPSRRAPDRNTDRAAAPREQDIQISRIRGYFPIELLSIDLDTTTEVVVITQVTGDQRRYFLADIVEQLAITSASYQRTAATAGRPKFRYGLISFPTEAWYHDMRAFLAFYRWIRLEAKQWSQEK